MECKFGLNAMNAMNYPEKIITGDTFINLHFQFTVEKVFVGKLLSKDNSESIFLLLTYVFDCSVILKSEADLYHFIQESGTNENSLGLPVPLNVYCTYPISQYDK